MKRTCFTCKNVGICSGFKGINDALSDFRANIDIHADVHPIYQTLAESCLKYDKTKEG